MAKGEKTPKKHPPKPFEGVKDGVSFTKDNQPDPELKKLGWQKWRAKKMLTQEIIKHMAEGDNLKQYMRSLLENAKAGNAKAIEAINTRIEDEINKIQVEHTGPIKVTFK